MGKAPPVALSVMLAIAALVAVFRSPAFAVDTLNAREKLLHLSRQLCTDWSSQHKLGPVDDTVSTTVEQIRVGTRHTLAFADQTRVELDVIDAPGRTTQYLARFHNHLQKPELLVSLAADCTFRLGRRIHYDTTGMARYIAGLGQDMSDSGDRIPLNPPLPPLQENAADHQGSVPVRVAMIDSGVNYLLPHINRRLARTPAGQVIAYDFWDLDPLPFDASPARSAFFIQRHGTRTASLLLAEAPGIELVAYRYPRPDMSRMRDLIAHANEHNVSIIGLPLGGNRAQEWAVFNTVAARNPHILFIASAGNNGRDIDQAPLYPAALPLANLLVVTSADDFVRPAERTNWGAISVDYLLPAELLATTDFNGEARLVSGSSYAVSRLTALAANIKTQHRGWQAQDIIAEINSRFVIRDSQRWVAEGYIPDPLAVHDNHVRRLSMPRAIPEISVPDTAAMSRYALSLKTLVLDSRWSAARIRALLEQAFVTLARCGIVPGDISVERLETAGYLSHLSVGGAHTLLGDEPQDIATAVLGNDTRMLDPYEAEAFGLGNTRTRPWLRNTVWLVQSIRDEGVALAHELFHILANDGAHVQQSYNLMQDETSAENTRLTHAQCARAIEFGTQARLLATLP